MFPVIVLFPPLEVTPIQEVETVAVLPEIVKPPILLLVIVTFPLAALDIPKIAPPVDEMVAVILALANVLPMVFPLIVTNPPVPKVAIPTTTPKLLRCKSSQIDITNGIILN